MTKTLPTKLFKFRNLGKNTESIFKKQELYFAAPSAFNDPFDCGFHILCAGADSQQILEASAFRTVREERPDWGLDDALDAAKQVAEEMASNRLEETTQVFQKKLADDSNSKAGICSLSERNDDILMWSHYADEHKGICIEFRTDVEASFFAKAQPVVYSEEYPHLNLYDVVTNEDLRAAAPWMLTKSKHWEYEKEWRILDFDTGPGVRRFPAKCLSGVILGCRIPDDDKEKVMNWVSAIPHEMTVYEAKESRTHFRLQIAELE